MKYLNLPQAAFLVLLYMKATGTPAFGHPVPWAVVFLPFFIQLLGLVFNTFFLNSSLIQRGLYWIWKQKLNKTINQAAKQARTSAINNLKTSNPGQYTDPANYGK
jgi:hypothetical protein